MKTSLWVIISFVVCTFFLACGVDNESATAEHNNTQKTGRTATVEFTWYTDWDSGMEAAKKEKKPVIVDFYADWCKWCKVMDEKTFSAPEIKSRFAAGWVAIKIDTENKNKTATVDGKSLTYVELARYFRITGLPTYMFIDKEGEPVAPISRYVPKEKFAHILDYFKDEMYTKKIKLDDYVKSHI